MFPAEILLADLRKLLDSVKDVHDIAISGQMSGVNPGIAVAGLDSILALPVHPRQALELTAVCSASGAAPSSSGGESTPGGSTLARAPSAWQLEPAKVTVRNGAWSAALEPCKASACEALGVKNSKTVTAEARA